MAVNNHCLYMESVCLRVCVWVVEKYSMEYRNAIGKCGNAFRVGDKLHTICGDAKLMGFG